MGLKFFYYLISFLAWSQLTYAQYTQSFIKVIDIVPTLLNIAGLKVPNRIHIQVRTLQPILTGETPPDSFRRFVRSACYNCFTPRSNHKSSYATMFRTTRYKIVDYHSPVSTGELFDLKKDPKEFHNE